jgi:hypothetical protein
MDLNQEICYLKNTLKHLELEQIKKDNETINTLIYIVKDGKEKFNNLDQDSKDITLFLEKVLDIVLRLKQE